MAADVEMVDLSHRLGPYAADPEQIPPESRLVDEQPEGSGKDAVIAPWAWTSAALLAILSLTLVIFPRMLLFAAETTQERRASLTELEKFLSLHFAIFLAAVAIALILNVPSASPPVARQQQYSPEHPLLGPITGASILSAFICYNTRSVGSLASTVCVFSSVVGIWGLWAIVFGTSSRISKKTGADKHTSAFIFGNKAAASKQKKEWKKQQKQR